MKRQDIESLLRTGFEKTVPDVVDSVLEQCGEQKGSVIIMTEKGKKRTALKAVLIAAAAAAILSVTAAAVSFRGLIDERGAFVAAYNHLYETAEGQEQTDIGNLILAGMPIEDAAEMQEADIGLKGLRPVYNLTFTLVGTVYHYTVDARTGVIIASSSEPLEDTDKREPVYERHPFVISEAEKNANYNRTYALNAVQDYFGCFSRIYPGAGDEKFAVNFFNDVYSSEDGYYDIAYFGGGYKYSCKVDMTTGEIYDDKIEKDELFTGEEEDRFKVEPLEGVIGHNAALKAACEAAGIEYTLKYCGDAFLGYVEYFDAGSFSGYVPYNSAVYPVTLSDPDAGEQRFRYKVYVDAATGEALSVTQLGIIGINKSEDEYHSDLNRGQLAIYAVRHRFGLTDWPTRDELPGEYLTGSAEYGVDGNFLVAVKYDGYIYRCVVDPETFAILSENIEEDPMADEITIHQGDPDMIGQVRAIEIVADDLGVDIFDPELYFISDCEVLDDGRKVYHTYFNKRGGIYDGFGSYYIDCYTGEIVYQYDPFMGMPDAEFNGGALNGSDPTKPYEPNQVPSTEAKDGEISEAAALIAALEDTGAAEENVLGLTIERDGGEFVVRFCISDMETEYRVNAKSGKIVSKSGATSDRMISPDEAEKAVLADVGLKRKAVWDMTVTRVNRYSKLLYSVEYTYRGISQFGEVDVFTGEILSRSYPPEMDLSDLDTKLAEDEVLKTALSWLGDKDYDGCRIYGKHYDGGAKIVVEFTIGEDVKTCRIDPSTGKVEE